jgi:hypothetical protein
MTGRLIYQDGSGALLRQTASLAGSGQNFAHRTEAEDSALQIVRPTSNVITATLPVGYRLALQRTRACRTITAGVHAPAEEQKS